MATRIIDHEITANQLEVINKHIQKLNESLEFTVSLTTEERRRMSSVSSGRSHFLTKVFEDYAPEHENLRPPYFDWDESMRDYKLYRNLSNIEGKLRQMLQMVSDTRIASAHEAYSFAREFYGVTKQGKEHNVQGAHSIYNDLKKLYDGQGNHKEPAPEFTSQSQDSDAIQIMDMPTYNEDAA